MRRSTAIESAFKADSKYGESLNFKFCKGGYFPQNQKYGLRVSGKSEQSVFEGKNLCNIANTTYSEIAMFPIGTTLSAGTYTLSGTFGTSDSTLNQIGIAIYSKKLGKQLSWLDCPINERIYKTFAIAESATYMYFYSGFSAVGSEGQSGTIQDLQIESGAIGSSFEPFCGAMPSPNPFYPQEIQNVGANTQIICKNKISLPCDLYKYDNWYPTIGLVERGTQIGIINELCAFSDSYYNYETGSGFIYTNNINKKNGVSNFKIKECIVLNYDTSSSRNLFAAWGRNNNNAICFGGLKTLGISSKDEWIDFIKVHPLTCYYEAENLIEENYGPQFLCASRGNVDVFQKEEKLKADLSVTMLVRRQ